MKTLKVSKTFRVWISVLANLSTHGKRIKAIEAGRIRLFVVYSSAVLAKPKGFSKSYLGLQIKLLEQSRSQTEFGNEIAV